MSSMNAQTMRRTSLKIKSLPILARETTRTPSTAFGRCTALRDLMVRDIMSSSAPRRYSLVSYSVPAC